MRELALQLQAEMCRIAIVFPTFSLVPLVHRSYGRYLFGPGRKSCSNTLGNVAVLPPYAVLFRGPSNELINQPA